MRNIFPRLPWRLLNLPIIHASAAQAGGLDGVASSFVNL
jgi:hypothetical protein